MKQGQSATAPQIVMVKRDKLRPAYWNPPDRITKRVLDYLVWSMEIMDQVVPAVITYDNMIVDGHRRSAACEAKGWPWLQARYLPEGHSAEEVYAQLNFAHRRSSMKDMFHVYLTNKFAVPIKYKDLFDRIQSSLGKRLMEEMLENGISPRTFTTVQRASIYTQLSIKEVMRWVINNHSGKELSDFLKAQLPARELTKVIEKDKPLILKLEIAS